MTLEELYSILTGTKLDVHYLSLPISESEPPYVVYYQTGVNNFAADGVVYYSVKRITIILYSAERDRTSEGLIETALATNLIYWTKTEEFSDSDKLFTVIYEIEV